MSHEPNACDAAAQCAVTIAEYGAWLIIAVVLLFAWVGTPA